ncbi:MAG: nickel-dependent lactate racemase [Sporomusaceae bacterium]|nr:nickel-dependent lactate racemase [Sporomusaceae bacterium]
MREYTFAYGKDELSFRLDPALVSNELKIKDYPVLSDPAAAIRQALAEPIGCKPLRELVRPGETVAFIVNDPTRVANSHVFMPILVDEMNAAGINDQDMTIVFALGSHRLMNEAEMAHEVGESVAKRVKMVNSDAKDLAQFSYFGETSRGTPVWFHNAVVQADHIICTGSIVHHFFAGFGGGRKAMLPGVSAYETIRKNHSMIFDPQARIGKLEGNPIYHDQIEGVEMHRPTFLLNVVLNEKKEFLAVFAGDYIQAHLAGCKLVDAVYGAELDAPADLVIATCGGFPKDINVYQMQKTMDNVRCAVRDGGVVILLGECREGTGSAVYEEWMRRYKTPERIEAMVKADFQIGAHKAYAVTRLMKNVEFILVSAMEPEFARLLLFTPAGSMEEALALAFSRLGPKPRIVLMPQGSLTVPRIRGC